MEIWKDIKGYEGKYQASDLGNIRSLNYHRENKLKLLTQCKDKDGYKVVLLYNNGRRKQFRVHRIIAETFLNNDDMLPCINHKDENKANNNVSNLEYCTTEYNNQYSKSRALEQCDLNGNVVRVWCSVREASDNTGAKEANISACCRGYGRHKTAGGYKWRYI